MYSYGIESERGVDKREEKRREKVQTKSPGRREDCQNLKDKMEAERAIVLICKCAIDT